MFTLMWMPDPDSERDEIDTIMGNIDPELCFRWVNSTIGNSGLNWTMDGDGWSSEWIMWDGEFGQFYITRQ